MTYFSPEARLLDRGWQAPPDLARAIVQREAFYAAIADLAHHNADTNQIAAPLTVADRDGIREAIVSHAVASFLDAECNRLEGTFSDWGAQLSNTIAAELARDPHGILDTLAAVPDPDNDGAALRSAAEQYAEAMTHTFGIGGTIIAPQPTRRTFDLVPRHPQPLPPAAPLPEPAEDAPAEEVTA